MPKTAKEVMDRLSTTGKIEVRNEILRVRLRKKLADAIAQHKGRIPKLRDKRGQNRPDTQMGITTRDLPVEVAAVLGKKLDRGGIIEAIIEASIDYVSPEIRKTAKEIVQAQEKNTGKARNPKKIRITPYSHYDQEDHLKTVKSKDSKTRTTRTVHVQLDPNMSIGSGRTGTAASDARLQDISTMKFHPDISPKDARTLDRTSQMTLPKLKPQPQGQQELNTKGREGVVAHELLHIHDPADRPGFGPIKRRASVSAPVAFYRKHGHFPNMFDHLLGDYSDRYVRSREERHTFSGVAGTYGVEALKARKLSKSKAQDFLRSGGKKLDVGELGKVDQGPRPTHASLIRPKTKVGRLARRIKAGLTPGGYKAFAQTERQKLTTAQKKHHKAEQRQRFAFGDTGREIEAHFVNMPTFRRFTDPQQPKVNRKAGQKYFKEIHKGIERTYPEKTRKLKSSKGGMVMPASKPKLPESVDEGNSFYSKGKTKDIQSEPSKWVRLRDPQKKTRSTDAAITEAMRRVKKRVEQTGISPLGVRTPANMMGPLDSAGSTGFSGPAGRTVHANL